jgi:alpha-amylase
MFFMPNLPRFFVALHFFLQKIKLKLLMYLILFVLATLLLVALYRRKKNAKTDTDALFYDLQTPDWVKNSVIYQVNIRQFSKEGNFNAFTEQLPRLKDLGVDVLWLMPIFPICEDKKKCHDYAPTDCWGSPYAPYDFQSIHAGYGTDEDLHHLIKTAHLLRMKVILDFVPNHTGFESKWMIEHPEWFIHKEDGSIMPVTSDQGEEWADIAQLDLNNKDMREAWMQAHEYWIREFDIDGYREDCAWAIPQDYWLELRQRLNAMKPVYMLAEDEVHGKEQFDVCFETNYGWGNHHFMKNIAQGKYPADVLHRHTEDIKNRFGTRGWQMNFTQNHDENTWHGSEQELFGNGGDCYTALIFVMEGQPCIYNGQEAGLAKRLFFFNKDEIDWSDMSRTPFIKKLIDLKHKNKALWNGRDGGFIQKMKTTNDAKVYAFAREKEGNQVVCIFNMTDTPLSISIKNDRFTGLFEDVFSGEKVELGTELTYDLQEFDYRIYRK